MEDRNMMGRAEKKYLLLQNIIAWGNGKYKERDLYSMTIPELEKIYNYLYFKKLSNIY
jgi:hypothetical protein